MNIKAKTIRGIFWSAIQGWGSQIVSLIVFSVLTRLLEPKDFGLVALASVYMAFLQIFIDGSFTQALIQRQELEKEHLNTAFWTNLVIGILLSAIGVMSASSAAEIFAEPKLAPVLQGFSIVFTIASLRGVQQALLERQFAYKAIAVRFLMGTFIGGAIAIVCALRGFGVWSLVIQQLVAELVGVVVLWKASEWRPQWEFSRQHFQDLFGFGINILALNFLGFINNRSDDLLIGYFLGSVALGYYAIAYRILTIMTQLLVNSTNQVALPTFSRLQTEPDRFRHAYYRLTQTTSAIAFPIFFGIFAVAPEIVEVVFGDRWLPSIPVLQVLAFVGLFRSVTYFKGSVFMALGKPSWKLWLNLLSAGLNLIGFFLAVRWGIVAVACAYLARACIVFPIGQKAIGNLIRIPFLEYLRQFITPFLSSLGMTVAILGVKQILGVFLNSFILLVLCTIVGIFVYGLNIYYFDRIFWQKLKELLGSMLSASKR
jgi:O-antigen/teichoic acid export membrane protein